MRSWLADQKWGEIVETDCASEKLANCVVCHKKGIQEFFPEKTLPVNSDVQPWISCKLKAMDRRRE